MKKPDKLLKEEIFEELNKELKDNSAGLRVKVKEGVVTILGHINSYPHKLAAERAVKRVDGVTDVTNQLEVTPEKKDQRSDHEIANSVINALTADVAVPHQLIRVAVNNGVVTLEGTVEWKFQHEAAASAIRNIIGVKGLHNLIIIKPDIKVNEIRSKLLDAFKRSALIDANKVTIEVDRGKVILSGTVRTWAEREDAERATWTAPGVTIVENNIQVNYDMHSV